MNQAERIQLIEKVLDETAYLKFSIGVAVNAIENVIKAFHLRLPAGYSNAYVSKENIEKLKQASASQEDMEVVKANRKNNKKS